MGHPNDVLDDETTLRVDPPGNVTVDGGLSESWGVVPKGTIAAGGHAGCGSATERGMLLW